MNIINEIIKPDSFYHIYNRGINSCEIFYSEENYLFFMKKFSKYMNAICDVYSYCLMPNHFHFLIKIKSEEEIFTFAKTLNPNIEIKDKGLHSLDAFVSKQIGKFISSYSQAFNKVNQRHGALLGSPFKRKLINSEEYLLNLIVYIHLNPIDLGLNFNDFKFSSFKAISSNSKTKINREEVIRFFGDRENFIYCHEHPIKFELKF